MQRRATPAFAQRFKLFVKRLARKAQHRDPQQAPIHFTHGFGRRLGDTESIALVHVVHRRFGQPAQGQHKSVIYVGSCRPGMPLKLVFQQRYGRAPARAQRIREQQQRTDISSGHNKAQHTVARSMAQHGLDHRARQQGQSQRGQVVAVLKVQLEGQIETLQAVTDKKHRHGEGQGPAAARYGAANRGQAGGQADE